MARVQLACMLVLAAGGAASAGPTRKVRIDTTPPHATVYFNDKDSKPVCTDTPCTVDAPVGETPVIIELDKYAPLIDLITVPKKADASPMRVQFKLAHASATLAIETAFAKGASVTVDDIDEGKVPVKIDLDPGQHHVVVTMSGQKLLEKDITLEIGEERDLPVKNQPEKKPSVAVNDDAENATTDPPDGTGSGSARDSGGRVDHGEERPDKPHGSSFAIGAVLDFVLREFKYTGGLTNPNNLYSPTYDQVEQGPLLGGTLEVWPMALLHAGFAEGFSVFGKAAFGVAPLTVKEGTMSIGLTTHWSNIEVSGRYRFALGDSAYVEPGVGYVRDQLIYDGDGANIPKVPLADYQCVRIGLRAGLPLGTIEPFASGELRVVLHATAGENDVATRLGPSSTAGYQAGLGANIRLGPLMARVGAFYTIYIWKFSDGGMMTMGNNATGAGDQLVTFSAQLGYSY